jgi:hypothetical protein
VLSRSWLLALCVACKSKVDAPSPVEITERVWRAHELVIAAGEAAKTCAEAGPAMQAILATHRQAFADSFALDGDKARLSEATDYIEQAGARYRAIEARLDALEDRCGEEPSVAAAFRQMESP